VSFWQGDNSQIIGSIMMKNLPINAKAEGLARSAPAKSKELDLAFNRKLMVQRLRWAKFRPQAKLQIGNRGKLQSLSGW
jgi:hypothetical protein